ncbi:hypothetical protein CBR_g66639 [Chara braunii]|uniref:CCHC-type domain-containing protein n=1 Tax=Chara braunii TaxID=69332 RepID=A0A388JPU4_CHABU|nr:hypothetical protein CBR_g66639 [Chara braunii]|eukprot:GBG59836.1 hypothetical protein CBR_g66639 [Chara braunii]
MGSSGGRDFGREHSREQYSDRNRESGYDGGRDTRREYRRERTMEYGSSNHQEWGRDPPPRRFTPVCYECGEPGHYRNQCSKLGGEGNTRSAVQRGRSFSPKRQGCLREARATSEDPALRQQIEDLATTIGSVKEHIDAENRKKEEKAKRKQEKEEQKRREEEARREEEQAREAAERRKKRKEVKLRQIAEDREPLKKNMRMEVSMHMGGLREELMFLRERGGQQSTKTPPKAKGKQKIEERSSDEESYGSYESEIEALSNQTEQLGISKKRTRGEDMPLGDSPPMETPAKRTTKRRLHLSVTHPPMKRSPVGHTPRRCATTKEKIPAAPRSSGKLKFVTDNLRKLGKMNVEELKRLCAQEDVQLGAECRKMQILLTLTDKRTQMAYKEEERLGGTEEQVAVETQQAAGSDESHNASNIREL